MFCGFPIQCWISRTAQNFYGTGNIFKIIEVIFDCLSDHIGTRTINFVAASSRTAINSSGNLADIGLISELQFQLLMSTKFTECHISVSVR